MPELRLSDKVKEYLQDVQGKEVTLDSIRSELRIDPSSNSWHSLRKLMLDLTKDNIVKPSGRRDGIYKVITQVKPVQVFGRTRKPPITLHFPKDIDTLDELFFGKDIIVREGDLILISGRSNYGKTAICLNFCAENIDSHPVLMGNEYTTLDHEPSPRFMNRLDNMDWVEWSNGNGEDKFTLLPVFDDYAEHIVKGRINIIDWINVREGEFYMISRIMEDVKRAVGGGVGIIALQKGAGADSGRGGQFTKDFADVEILLDSFNKEEILMTLGKVKESHGKLTGKAYAFGLRNGVKITDFRELQKCTCFNGFRGGKKCSDCDGAGYTDA